MLILGPANTSDLKFRCKKQHFNVYVSMEMHLCLVRLVFGIMAAQATRTKNHDNPSEPTKLTKDIKKYLGG